MTVLPRVSGVAEQLCERVLAGRGSGEPVWVTGLPGTGKTTVLDLLHEFAAERGWPVIRLSPTSGDLDGPASAIAQGAGSLIEHGVNGALGGVFDPKVPFRGKLHAFGTSLVAAQDSLVLVDMPDSWARPRFGKDGGTFAFQGEDVVREVLNQRNGHRVVLASSRRPLTVSVRTVEMAKGGGMEMLGDSGVDWQECQFAADALVREVPTVDLAKLTPLGVRLAVALSALGLRGHQLRNACRGGWPMLRSSFQVEVLGRRWLRETLFAVSHARVSVGDRLLSQLLDACEGEDQTSSRSVLRDAILLREPTGWTLHPQLRTLDVDLDNERARELADISHRRLAEAWAQSKNPRTWAGIIAWWESLHHWAEAGADSKLAQDQVPDVSMWTTLGRRLSRRGDYAAAVHAFRHAVDLQPDDSYAHEYLAYNLDRLGERRSEAERSFRRAVELNPANPWWNRRLVQALQRRGKIEEAWDAWIAALENIEDATEPSEWLQEHLHRGVCRGFLERGQAEFAAEVLSSVPREQWIPVFHELFNVVLHRREAQWLEASLFPEDLRFDGRWKGPHLGDDDSRLQSWFPGRIVSVDEEQVELELGEPPASEGQEPEVFGLTLSVAEFLEQAELPAHVRPRLDQLLEVHVYEDDPQRIFLHASPHSGGGADFDLLSSFRS